MMHKSKEKSKEKYKSKENQRSNFNYFRKNVSQFTAKQ